MKKLGWLLIFFAISCLAIALFMDTSVSTGIGRRIVNLSLMSFQQNTLIVGVGLFIAGAIFVTLGGRNAMEGSGTNTYDNPPLRVCPFCAEMIQKKAILCRYCGRDIPPIEHNSSHEVPKGQDNFAAGTIQINNEPIVLGAEAGVAYSKLGFLHGVMKSFSIGGFLIAVVSVIIFSLQPKHPAPNATEETVKSSKPINNNKINSEYHLIPMDNMVVNLADPGGEKVAQIGITLEVADHEKAGVVREYLPKIRNDIIVQISKRTAAELLSIEGKEKLAKDIQAIGETNGPGHNINGVLYTSFSVQ